MVNRWLATAFGLLLAACGAQPEQSAPGSAATGLKFLGGAPRAGFEQALAPRAFVFPEDHGSHPGFRTEWWYYTGNLETAAGRHFGFELTFFRYALRPPPSVASGSAWRASEAWMAHFAITDTEGGQFSSAERIARGALGLAGITGAPPFELRVKDWSMVATPTEGGLEVQLRAADGEHALDLALIASAPPVAQGDGGLDRKGPETGNASYYYSMPRLAARGRVTVGGQPFDVTGLAWLDREWSTSSLSADIAGWDWLALNLADGSSLMFYRLRRPDGTPSAFSSGSLVRAGGSVERLAYEAVSLTPTRWWTSPRTGRRYPVAWRLSAPELRLSLEIEPYLDAQELDLSVRYWEGAVRARGTGPAGPLRGSGYLELTGY